MRAAAAAWPLISGVAAARRAWRLLRGGAGSGRRGGFGGPRPSERFLGVLSFSGCVKATNSAA